MIRKNWGEDGKGWEDKRAPEKRQLFRCDPTFGFCLKKVSVSLISSLKKSSDSLPFDSSSGVLSSLNFPGTFNSNISSLLLISSSGEIPVKVGLKFIGEPGRVECKDCKIEGWTPENEL